MTISQVLIVEDIPEISAWLSERINEAFELPTITAIASFAAATEAIKQGPWRLSKKLQVFKQIRLHLF